MKPNSAIGFEMEIEEENFSFFFFKELSILTDLDKEVKEKISLEIETQLINLSAADRYFELFVILYANKLAIVPKSSL